VCVWCGVHLGTQMNSCMHSTHTHTHFRPRACGLAREHTLLNGNGYFTHHIIITLPSICAGMSCEETAIFLANMGADERTKFLTAMHAEAMEDACVQASDFITASPGIQVSVTLQHVLAACPRSMSSASPASPTRH